MKIIYEHLTVKTSTAEETAKLLTEHVQEVEGISHTGSVATGVVSARITDVQKHPNADRLRIVSVDLGDQMLDIVTGAPNVEIGQIVALALEGAIVRSVDHSVIDPGQALANEYMTIKNSIIRGVESKGMLCGADELGLSDVVSKDLFLFPANTPLGRPLQELMPSKTIIEVDDKGSAHRPDLLSYAGIEQELAAILNKSYANPITPLPAKMNGDFAIDIATPTCTTFMAAVITDLKTFESLQWLQKFLSDHEIKVVNLPTDVTNYIALKEGYPTHAFDADKISGKRITVRAAKDKETVNALNNHTYTLATSDIVLADDSTALDIAGVIGGRETATTAGTKSIVLTGAVLDPKTVRVTSRKFGIRTDAAARFERGVSLQSAINGFSKAVALILELSGGKVTYLDTVGKASFEPKHIKLELSQVSDLLGVQMPRSDVVADLKRFNYNVTDNGDTLDLVVPWNRGDVNTPADVIEDIARVYGYNNLPATLTSVHHPHLSDEIVTLAQRLRQAASATFKEVEVSSMVESAGNGVEIENFIGNKKYMRTAIAPQLFKIAQANYREGYAGYSCFTIGSVYFDNEKNLPAQPLHIAFAAESDPEKLKKQLGLVLHRLHLDLDAVTFSATGEMSIDGKSVGLLTIALYKGKTFSMTEISVSELLHFVPERTTFRAYSAYPAVKRDIAFVVEDKAVMIDLVTTMQKSSDLITHVEMFDRFTNNEVGTGKQSLAFHLTFQAMDKTLTDTEVNAIVATIEKSLESKYQARIRS